MTQQDSLQKSTLPIDASLGEIVHLLRRHSNIVVTAAPGAGKTTRVPPALLNIFTGKVLVLEPRRIAAASAALRIAEENQWELGGNEVGYQVRFENKTNPKTRLVFLTEALLTKHLLRDTNLTGVDCVVIDEFHERSLHTDLALGLLREMQLMGHPIKMVVMSATLDAEKLAKYLGNDREPCPVIDSPGKLFPLTIDYQKSSQSLVLHPQFFQQVRESVLTAASRSQADVLVFLPGVGEIKRALSACENLQSNFDLCELHGGLDIQDQRKILKGRGQKRRVIFSTNLAESSITLDGVDAVVDCGLEKVASEDPLTQFTQLDLARISMASAHQRAGRAARQSPGYCLRMWNKLDERSMPEMAQSEVSQKDLSEPLLWLAIQGVHFPESFLWYEKPPDFLIQAAREKLLMMELVKIENGGLQTTPMGRELLKFPLPLAMGRLCLISKIYKLEYLAAKICACLESDLARSGGSSRLPQGDPHSESDLLELLSHADSLNSTHPVRRTIERETAQILELIRSHSQNHVSNVNGSSEQLNELLLTALPFLLCKRRPQESNDQSHGHSHRAILSNGSGVVLSENSAIKTSEFFIALKGTARHSPNLRHKETMINIAAGIDKSLIFKTLGSFVRETNECFYDHERQQFYTATVKYLFELVLEKSGIRKASSEEVGEQLQRIAIQEWEFVCVKSESLGKILNRCRYLARLAQHNPEMFAGAPEERVLLKEIAENLDEDKGLQDEVRDLIVGLVCYGESSLKAVIEKDWGYFIGEQLGKTLWKCLETQVPSGIQTPRGKWSQIHYPPDSPPYFEAKIQDCFGWQSGPQILFGKVFLRIHLLGPNFRPVQITDDLAGFWRGSYADVRKELRARYPKHKWPEDPTVF